jgi:hypothetical protein
MYNTLLSNSLLQPINKLNYYYHTTKKQALCSLYRFYRRILD